MKILHHGDKRRRRDASTPKSITTKKRAIERLIRSLASAPDLDHQERFAALTKIYNAIDRLNHHAVYKEGWERSRANALEDELRRAAKAAHTQAEENYRQHLREQLTHAEARAREARIERLSTPHGRYAEELKLSRGRDKWAPKLNGVAKRAGKRPFDFNVYDLALGTRIELEHTGDARTARQIAMDHLTERPDYYQRLLKYVERDPRKLTAAQRTRLSRKIRLLRHEGYSQRQAVAIAYSMLRLSSRKKRIR